MDYQFITRVESQAANLFKLGEESRKKADALKTNRKSFDVSPQKKILDNDTVANSAPMPPNPGTTSSSTAILQEKHYEDLYGCASRNFTKGFTIGFFANSALNFASEIIVAMRKRQMPVLTKALLTDGSNDLGFFMGALLSIHNSFMFVTRNLGNDKLLRYRGAVAGFISSFLSINLLPNKLRDSAMLFTFIRSVELFFRVLAERGSIPSFTDGDSMLMSFASCIMIYQYVYSPKNLDPAYVHFLNRQVQVPPVVVEAIGIMQTGKELKLDLLKEHIKDFPKEVTDGFIYDKSADLKQFNLNHGSIVLHPQQSFVPFAGKYFLFGIQNAAYVYLPVYLSSTLIMQFRELMKHPKEVGMSAFSGFLRSCIFLSAYCTIGITSLSVMRSFGLRYDVIGSVAQLTPALSGGLAGFFSTLLEKKARRIELALYVLLKAVEKHFKDSNRLIKQLLFSVSFSVICHVNLRYPHLIRRFYRELLFRFLDTDQRHKFL